MKSIVRLVIVFACALASFGANAQKPTTALELNDYLASFTDSLYQGGREWGKTLNAVVTSKKFDSLAGPRKKMDDFITRKQAEIKDMKDINGSEDLRKAMLEFLDFEAKMIKDAFLPLEKFTATSPKEDIKKAIDDLIAMAATEKDHLSKVNVAQEAYAKKNGFTIEKKDDEK
jgi:hypothetical protein